MELETLSTDGTQQEALLDIYISEIITIPPNTDIGETEPHQVNKVFPSKIYTDENNNFYLQKPEYDTTGELIKDDQGNLVYDSTKQININDLPTATAADIVLKNMIETKINDVLGGDLYGSSDEITSNTVYPYLSTKINENSENSENKLVSDLFKYFYNNFFSLNYEFDVNGYNLIFLYPPDFSGYKQLDLNQRQVQGVDTDLEGSFVPLRYISPPEAFFRRFKDFMIFAVEYDIPEHEIATSQITLANKSSIEFVSGFKTSGDLSVRYLDNSKLKMYNFHSRWVSYMKMIMRGDLDPADEYYDTKEVDYMASMYFLKFKPNMDHPIYIGKASGVFPKNLPVKELFGSRATNELLMYSINYFYSLYEGTVLTYETDTDGHIIMDSNSVNGLSLPKLKQESLIYNEFNKLILTAYTSSDYSSYISNSGQ
jgi:hypothetical protein